MRAAYIIYIFLVATLKISDDINGILPSSRAKILPFQHKINKTNYQ